MIDKKEIKHLGIVVNSLRKENSKISTVKTAIEEMKLLKLWVNAQLRLQLVEVELVKGITWI